MCLVELLCAGSQAQGTAPSNSQFVYEPEIDTYIGLTEKIRFEFETSRTTDGVNFSSASIGPSLQFTLKPILRRGVESNDPRDRKYFTFSAGYRYISNANGPDENRIQLDLTPRYYLPWSLLLSDRNRFDLRWIGGVFSWRYRNRLTLERSFRIRSFALSPYAQGEVFYDSRTGTWSQNTYEFGAVVPIRKRFQFKSYYQHENARNASPPIANAFGMTLYIFLRRL